MTHDQHIFDSNRNPSHPSTCNPSSRPRTPSSSSTSTSRHTEPGVSCEADELEALKVTYNEVLGPMNATVAHLLQVFMLDGMEVEVICNAIHQTAWCRRPSPQYLRAILCRYNAEGIRTMNDVLRSEAEYDSRKRWFED